MQLQQLKGMQSSEVCERGKKGVYLKKSKGLHFIGAELTPPHGGKTRVSRCDTTRFTCPPFKSRVFSLLYAPLSDECHCQIVSRVIIHDSHANL